MFSIRDMTSFRREGMTVLFDRQRKDVFPFKPELKSLGCRTRVGTVVEPRTHCNDDDTRSQRSKRFP